MSSRIFLSYSRADAAQVDWIRAELSAAGHDVWVDTDDLRGGDRWRAAIVEAIEQADAVVVVISQHSVESDHVVREVQLASEQDARLVPLRLDSAKLSGGLRYTLSGIHEIDLAGDRFGGMRELLAALGPASPGAVASATETISSRSPAPPERKSSRVAWLVGTLASVVVVVVVVVLVVISGNVGQDPPPNGGQPDPDSCIVTITNRLVTMHEEPARFALELRGVPLGDHTVTETTVVSFGGLVDERWLKITIDGQAGWITDSTFNIDRKSPGCTT